MKIKDILGTGKPTLSFEVFPPKTEDKIESVDLIANGGNAIHVYSMNKPDVPMRIQESLSEILR